MVNNIKNKKNIAAIIFSLWKYFPRKRKIQFFFISALMMLNGFSEIFLLASILPFIKVITNPQSINNNKTIEYLIDLFNIGNNSILYITIIFIISIYLASGLRILTLWLSGRYASGLGTDLSLICFEKIINQSYEYHLNKNSSNLISLISKDITSTVSIIQNIINMLTAIISLIFISAGVFIIDRNIFLLTVFCFLGSYFLIILNSKKQLKINSKKIIFLNTNQVKILQESLGSIKDIILNNLYKYYFKNFKANEYKIRRIATQNKFISLFPRYAIEGVSLSFIALLSFIIAINQKNGVISIERVGVLAIGAQRLLPNFQLIYSYWTNIQSNKMALVRVLDCIDKNFYKDTNLKVEKIIFERSIELKNAFFQYDKNSNKKIINGVNLSILKGDKIGIIGESGCGKSTLLDILNGLLKPQSGNLYIDGIPIYGKDDLNKIKMYRKIISYVPQNIFLTDNSIAENIAFGIDKNMIDFNRLNEIVKIVELYDFIHSNNQKYDLKVGEKGIRLSGGQLQRIGIARALYNKSEIIFLDEATSALDNKTEKKIISRLNNLGNNITLIMIAHRLSSLNSCNKILEFKGGEVYLKKNNS